MHMDIRSRGSKIKSRKELSGGTRDDNVTNSTAGGMGADGQTIMRAEEKLSEIKILVAKFNVRKKLFSGLRL